MALINYKHQKHIALKEVVNMWTNMIPTTQRWNKLSKDQQIITHAKTPRMCKDKWNYINGNYIKIFDYHKGIGHNTS